MNNDNLLIDNSYKIKEYIINSEWDKSFPCEYFEYRKQWDLANHGILSDKPLFLEIESTYACNYRCKMCPRRESDNFSDKMKLPDDLFEILFKQIKDYKIPSATFSHGGEPLMRKDLPDLIIKGKNAGLLDRMFHTNGYLLTKDISKKVIENGLTKINFSIDAFSTETYNKIRIGGDLNKVKQNIFDFLEIRSKFQQTYPRVRVSFVVQPENKDEMSEFFDFWKKYADVISFQELIELKVPDNSRKVKIIESDNNSVIPQFCTQLWQLLTIANNGDVLLCELDYNHEYVLGNLRKDTLLDCWNSELMQKARYYHKNGEYYKIPICKNCFKMRKNDL